MLKLKHADALIELLSVLSDDDMLELGLTAQQVEDLGDVWEAAHDYHLEVVGRLHPLAEPTAADDAEVEGVVISNEGSVH